VRQIQTWSAVMLLSVVGGCVAEGEDEVASQELAVGSGLDDALKSLLVENGFTGTIESQLEAKLGRRINRNAAELGRLMFFDKLFSLHAAPGNDAFGNPCAGCHTPAFGFGDSQRIAIGVDSNGIVGPSRTGPRNQRRAPFSVNAVFYPALMWTPRFFATSGNPFDNRGGFVFPEAAGGPIISGVQTLLMAQGQVAPTELVEMGGFTGTSGLLGDRFNQFDDGHGSAIPDPSHDGIQGQVSARVNANATYRQLFGNAFNRGVPFAEGQITIAHRRTAVGEFQATLLAADAPIDRYARGDRSALTEAQKRGAKIFFTKGSCIQCHKTSGTSNQMFSDFQAHRIGAPQVFPKFGAGTSNIIYDGPGENEDFGFEQTEGNPAVRYSFRTAPLRNLKVAPGFFHNGAVGTIEQAIRHHLDPEGSLASYDPEANGLPDDLTEGPFAGILALGIDPKVRGHNLTEADIADVTDFVENGLFDAKVLQFCGLIPTSVPSGMSIPRFEGCENPGAW
jgi:cytochrome c peroxidase